jgi:ABC-type iron transport system FetAB ATPase subunit
VIKDCNGNEFRVGCVVEWDGVKRKVVEVDDSYIFTIRVGDSLSFARWSASEISSNKICILHYKELAPDKNGFMLCEGDTVTSEYIGKFTRVIGYINTHCILQDTTCETNMMWCKPDRLTFVSRPTERKNTELIERLKKMEEAHAKEGEEIAKLKKEVGL